MMTPVLMARVLASAQAIHEASYSINVRPINIEIEGIAPIDMPDYDPDRNVYRRKDGRQTQEHGFYTIDYHHAVALALDAYQLDRAFIEPLALLLDTGWNEVEDWTTDILGPLPQFYGEDDVNEENDEILPEGVAVFDVIVVDGIEQHSPWLKE